MAVLRGYQSFTQAAGLCGVEAARNAFLASLCDFTLAKSMASVDEDGGKGGRESGGKGGAAGGVQGPGTAVGGWDGGRLVVGVKPACVPIRAYNNVALRTVVCCYALLCACMYVCCMYVVVHDLA